MTMAKKIKLHKVDDQFIEQGDVLTHITHTYEVSITNSVVDVVQLEFPYALVLSQSCDLHHGNRLINKEIKSESKVMFSVIVVPFFEKNTLISGKHLKDIIDNGLIDCSINNTFVDSNEMKVIENGLHYRYHLLEIESDEQDYPDFIIDFKTNSFFINI